LEIQVGAAKVAKYAVSESGDTLEMIERPRGGISAVLVDGQRSGRAAKIISNIVARKAISLLGEGVRDGAAARATHDYLCTHRGGQVSAELHIVSVDLQSKTVVISRNTHCPAYRLLDNKCHVLDHPSKPIGLYSNTKPAIDEIDLVEGTYVVAYTDGIYAAGKVQGKTLDMCDLLTRVTATQPSAQELADTVLDEALRLEEGRPADDMSVLVVSVTSARGDLRVRRMTVSFPVP